MTDRDTTGGAMLSRGGHKPQQQLPFKITPNERPSMMTKPNRENKEAAHIDKLEEEFKDSEKVRAIRLQALSKEFENLRMKKAEMVKDYTLRVVGVVNQLKLNREEILDKKVVQKVLINLLERFDAVTTAIEHTKDLSSLSLTELTCALLAYEQ
ncbi:Uncharacterized protein Adt_31503 [Abeliophyllum distichum]|uniref:Uncharacterized protein n=1 Tax=Abeliophyllum distichum TaxID=126358 RepID=A0ABD1REB2_9LAMI